VQPSYNELYTYDPLGNILSKTGVGAYSYSTTRPPAVTTAGPFGFGYDANGNMTTVGGKITTWDAEKRPTSIARVSGSETYTYDADGERVRRAAGFTTTVSLGGLWQEDVAGGVVGVTRVLYGFNGTVVAQRARVTSAPLPPHLPARRPPRQRLAGDQWQRRGDQQAGLRSVGQGAWQ
jgi:YD repeat-containing protein